MPLYTTLLALKKDTALVASEKPFGPPVPFWDISAYTDEAIAQCAFLRCPRVPQAVQPQSFLEEHLLDLVEL
jgi:hypothetical protein